MQANLFLFVHWTREEVRDILSESLGKQTFDYSQTRTVCQPAKQVFFAHWTRDEVRDILSESLGKQTFDYYGTKQELYASQLGLLHTLDQKGISESKKNCMPAN
jgi:hypothetical protein